MTRKSSNIVLSPVSVALGLSMLFPGSKRATSAQIKEQIAESFDDDLVIGFNALLSQMLAEQNELIFANRAFVENGFFVDKKFQNTVESCFDSTFQSVDFSDSKKSTRLINRWVREATKGRIKNVVPKGAINDLTRLILVNALHYRADWLETFVENSQNEFHRFYPLNDQREELQMMEFMHSVRDFNFYKERDLKVLGIPYAGHEMTMFFLLPENFLHFERSLTTKRLIGLLDKTVENRVKVDALVPKFTFGYQLPMKKILGKMGIVDMFDPYLANLTGIADVKPPLFVDDAFHKAFIDVHELGTEMGAGSRFQEVQVSSSEMFVPNKPFMFAVRHEDTGAILFLGVVVKAPQY